MRAYSNILEFGRSFLRASLIGSDYYQPEPEPRSGPEEYYLVVPFQAEVVLFRAASGWLCTAPKACPRRVLPGSVMEQPSLAFLVGWEYVIGMGWGRVLVSLGRLRDKVVLFKNKTHNLSLPEIMILVLVTKKLEIWITFMPGLQMNTLHLETNTAARLKPQFLNHWVVSLSLKPLISSTKFFTSLGGVDSLVFK